MQAEQKLAASQWRGTAVIALFTATIFTSAALLFFVQPLYAKIVVPHIGGSPAVWTTAMLFFQTTLLAGYFYAHLSTRYLAGFWQVAVHLALWAAALWFLPLTIPEGWQYDPTGSAAWQTLMLFAVGVGLPFGVLSANAPLIQSWYARSGAPSADDPYFLYGASNLGSFASLLAFPLVAEPLFGATAIGTGWAVGFVALGALLLASGGIAGRQATRQVKSEAPHRPGARRLIYWAALAFVPSSMMLAVTTKIGMDLGALPLVWVLPLALYLLSYVVSFSKMDLPFGTRATTLLIVSLVVLGSIFTDLFGAHLNWALLATLLAAFFLLAVLVHRKLYDDRPDSSHLTAFYLTVSVGGALGGLFNSIVAPLVFDFLYEGIVTVVIAAILMIDRVGSEPLSRSARTALAGGFAGIVTILLIVPSGAIFADRSFFGTHRVVEADGLRLYGNGSTVHGAQRLSDIGDSQPEPLYYYHRNGPMAQVLTSQTGQNASRIGIVGLGVGSLACYARPGQEWHFYEIDAMVDRVARDATLFGFMSGCAGNAPTHLGDARVVLAAQDTRFDVLVIDAYSSDAVPVHLTTLEAMALYLERLSPGGVLLFHISNRYYAIDRPLARAARALGLEARIQVYPGNVSDDPGDKPSTVMMLTRQGEAPTHILDDPRWTKPVADGPLWTDDHANLLGILK